MPDERTTRLSILTKVFFLSCAISLLGVLALACSVPLASVLFAIGSTGAVLALLRGEDIVDG